MSVCDRCGAEVRLVRVGTVIDTYEPRVREGDEVREWLSAAGMFECRPGVHHSVCGVLRAFYRGDFCVRQTLCG